MPLVCVACNCNNSDSIIRRKLEVCKYPGWLSIPVHKGKDKSLSALSVVPPCLEVDALKSYIKDHSSYSVILGYKDGQCRWADILSSRASEGIEAMAIVDYFG